ncbi:MAG TPA: DMT family transporter [Candidatus Dormibacteraeota bacterium]|jgi:drug/metabolite transporter (DMT)-like permease|nr:DMT family transporter [Candidatus Dormibacteraeota bacterium]
MTRRGWVLFAAMAVIWGIPYLLIKIAVGELTPVTLVFMRTTVGALLLLPIAAMRGGLRPLLPYWRWVLAYTVVEVSLPWFLLSDAERRLSSSLTGLLIAAVPLIGALVTWLTRGDERLDLRRIAGLVVGLVGVGALVGLNVSFRDLGAVGEVALVALGYATGPIIVSRRLPGVPAIGVVAASLVITALAYAPLAWRQLPATAPSPRVLLAVGILAVVCTALAFLLFFALIGEVGPVRATVITYFNPAVALLLGVTLLREPFTLGAVVGFSLILAGSLLATRRASEPAAGAASSASSSSASGEPDTPGPLRRFQE